VSRVDQVLAELAPRGVRHLALSELASYSSTRVDAAKLDETTFVGVDNLVANKGGRVDANYLPNTAHLTAYECGDILLGNIRPYLKKVWRATESGGCSGDVLAIRIKEDSQDCLDSEFLYYLLSSDGFFAYNMQHAKGAKMPRGSKVAILNYRIPVPPLEVQHEIVRVLDQFTQLEAELEAELEARTRQYDYYLNEMLRFEATVRRLPIGDFAVLVRGNGMPKTDFTEMGTPAIHYGQIYTHFGTWATETKSFVAPATAARLATVEPGDIVITNTSENLEDVGKAVAWLGDATAVTGGHATVIKHDENPKFLAYYFQTQEFHSAKRKHATGTKVIDVSARGLAKIEVPLPARSEQDRLVAILDDFDALVNDLSIGLPAELAARRKQYEYYRDKLLTFKESPA